MPGGPVCADKWRFRLIILRQFLGDFNKLFEGGTEVLCDLRRDHIRGAQLLIGEGPEPLTFHALLAFAHSVGGCERLQICPGELIFLSGEAHVLAQIISPEPGPWGSASGEFVV